MGLGSLSISGLGLECDRQAVWCSISGNMGTLGSDRKNDNAQEGNCFLV